jgi:hypothetical protein
MAEVILSFLSLSACREAMAGHMTSALQVSLPANKLQPAMVLGFAYCEVLHMERTEDMLRTSDASAGPVETSLCCSPCQLISPCVASPDSCYRHHKHAERLTNSQLLYVDCLPVYGSGLDHVLSGNEDINVLVLDTEGYSNTGGQQVGSCCCCCCCCCCYSSALGVGCAASSC